MNNEEKILEVLMQLTTSVNNISNKVNQIEIKVNELDTTQKQMQNDLENVKEKLSAVYTQTSELTEFKTFTKSKLDKIDILSSDIKFIKHKLHETEEDVFNIKDYLKIVK